MKRQVFYSSFINFISRDIISVVEIVRPIICKVLFFAMIGKIFRIFSNILKIKPIFNPVLKWFIGRQNLVDF